jgi:selenocysteine lyase/cysteine desulfurase
VHRGLGGTVEPHTAQSVACELHACDAEGLQRRLLERHAIEAVINKRGTNAFLRAAFQVYNDASDIDRLSDALSLEL